jgi:TnpA family transposase
VPTAREAHYVLDDFLGNATDLPVYEHATDTHGVTLINFALFDSGRRFLRAGCAIRNHDMCIPRFPQDSPEVCRCPEVVSTS